jgi:hypothetical protein
MRNPIPAPAEAAIQDADRGGPEGSAQLREWLVHCLALVILFLLEHARAARLRRYRRVRPWWQDRPDLPVGSIQALAASIRGPFGRAIASMCRRHGVGPGHKDWPELSRAIVAFGGNLKGFRAGAPSMGLQWWENPNIVPGMVPGFGAPDAALPQLQVVADTPPPLQNAMRVLAAPARLLASWLSVAEARLVFARAGPSLSTGPPGWPGLLPHSCLTQSRLTQSCSAQTFLTHGAGAWPAPP